MRKHIYSFLLIVALLGNFSCNDDYLNTKPGDRISDAAAWGDPAYAEKFLLNIYANMQFPRQWLEMASVVDEASFIQVDGVSTRVTESNMTPEEKGAMGMGNWADGQRNFDWVNLYKRIRESNLFLEKADGVPFAAEDQREVLKGEAHWLRAYNYYSLVKQYGGVPLIDKTITFVIDGDYSIARSSFEDCINFIVADLDAAAAVLPVDGVRTRATKGAALALKSRVLLYAASDLFNSNASWAGGYDNPELVGYVGGDRNARWQAARDAAKAVIDLGVYQLHKASPGPSDDIVQNLTEIFLGQTSEDIFLQINDNFNNGNFYYWQTDWAFTICGPGGYGGYELNQPLASLADAYEKNDGTPFDWGTGGTTPYVDRDPRFYATLLYEGASWIGRNVELGHWSDGTEAADYGGVTGTGYYMRKFIDPDYPHIYFGAKPNTPFTFIRYAEVLLNYAEACIELGQEDEARDAINQVRERAGMPPISDSGADLLARYRNERRIELAFEEHRFWDVRRWMIGEEAYVPAKGVDVVYPVDGSTANPEFSEKVVEPNRKWADSHYLMPIAVDEMNKNSLLVQNPLYN